MSPTKRRINVTLTKQQSHFLQTIADRDEVPEATKARQLIERALELEEDAYFSKEAERRDADTTKWTRHNSFWSKLA